MNIRSKAEYGRKLIMQQFEQRLDYQQFMINSDKFQQAKKFCLLSNHDHKHENIVYQTDQVNVGEACSGQNELFDQY